MREVEISLRALLCSVTALPESTGEREGSLSEWEPQLRWRAGYKDSFSGGDDSRE